jgi:hypothetical protein
MATISNTTYKLCKVTLPALSATFDLSPLDLNGNVFEKIYLDVDATGGDITINLPNISVFDRIFNFELVVNRIDNSLNAVKIVSFTDLVIVPNIVQFIGSAELIQIGTAYQTASLSPTTDKSWSALVSSGANSSLPAIVGGLAQVTLALAQYVDLAVGTTLIVQDYDTSGDACTIVKLSLASGDYQDWYVMATDNVLSSGAIGVNPI